MNSSTFAFLKNIFENYNLMKNKKCSIFSKLSSFYLGSLIECIWTPQLPFWNQIIGALVKTSVFFKIFEVKSQFLIKDEQKENKCVFVVYMRGLNDFRVIFPNSRIATLQLFIILAIRCVKISNISLSNIGIDYWKLNTITVIPLYQVSHTKNGLGFWKHPNTAEKQPKSVMKRSKTVKIGKKWMGKTACMIGVAKNGKNWQKDRVYDWRGQKR